MEKSQVELADKVRDVVTGFTGIVSGLAQFLTGCRQAMITPPVAADGKYVDAVWLDVDRLEVVEKQVVSFKVVDNGGPQSAPTRR